MPQVRHNQRGKRKFKFVAGALVLAGLLGGAYWAYVYFGTLSDAQFDAALRQTEISAGNKDYAQEAQGLNDLLSKSNTDIRKQIVLLRLGAAYANDKQYDKAIASYEKAANNYPDSKAAGTRGLAFLYMNRGKETKNVADLQQSQSYFEQALELEKQNEKYRSYVQNEELNIIYIKGLIKDASK